jgi:ligand-binding sensor domain-containing protein/signal transduction histidine kinase
LARPRTYRRRPPPALRETGGKNIGLHCAFILLVLFANPIRAVDSTLALRQYIHSSWTEREGFALPTVQALAQTPDGYLWLGTSSGIYRFDGVHFVPWKPVEGEALPNNEVRALELSRDGTLWIGTASGVSKLTRGRLQNFTARNGLPDGKVVTILEDHAGSLWVATTGSTSGSLSVIQNGSVKTYTTADGLPSSSVLSLFEDRANNLWIGASDGLCKWRPGAGGCSQRFPATALSVEEDGGGNLLVGDTVTRTVLRLSDGALKPAIRSENNVSLAPRVLLRDRDGNVWIGTMGQGLVRLRDGKAERFTRRDGLSGDLIGTLFEDREGNLWVGTTNGLDRFRNPKVPRLSTIEGLSGDLITSVYATRDGDTWVGTSGGGLNRLHKGSITHYLLEDGLPSTTITALFEDAGQRLWVATTAGLACRSQGRFFQVRAPDGGAVDRVFAITGDANGTLWLADGRRGLLRVRGGRIAPHMIHDLPNEKDIYQIYVDRHDSLWIGYYHGGLTVARDDKVTTYYPPERLNTGTVNSIYETRAGIMWLGTERGLSRLRNGVWTTWTKPQNIPEGGIHGIIEDEHDGLWMTASGGLLRASASELDASPNGSPQALVLSVYGLREGIRLGSGPKMANPRLAQSTNGVLWIATEDGVAFINPARMHSNALPPPVIIEQLSVDGKRLDTSGSTEPVFQGRLVQVQFAALSLTDPEGVRFRYQLEGVDPSWVEGGTLRNISYANLRPGRYRFRVIASNDDGVWNTTGASLAFHVQQRFYLTWWFDGLCILALALLAWGAHSLRQKQLRSRFELVLRERSRLTRDLHDTLLQGFAGVLYQLEAAWRQFDNAPEISRQKLERALEQADQSLREARHAIAFLRLPAVENSTLPEALLVAGKQFTDGTPIRLSLDVKGEARPFPYDVQANLYVLAREAVNNAVKHARPAHIMIEFEYTPDSLRLVVRDDGVGFDPESPPKKDRWGIPAMKERAEHIGATLTVKSSPGRGTSVEIDLGGRHRRIWRKTDVQSADSV